MKDERKVLKYAKRNTTNLDVIIKSIKSWKRSLHCIVLGSYIPAIQRTHEMHQSLSLVSTEAS